MTVGGRLHAPQYGIYHDELKARRERMAKRVRDHRKLTQNELVELAKLIQGKKP